MAFRSKLLTSTFVSFFSLSPLLLGATESLAPSLPSSRLTAKDGWNLFVEADWIYWQASETGLGYALNQEGLSTKTIAYNMAGVGEVANPKFEWKSGLRLGIGYNIPHDQWDLGLVWTTYEGKANDSQTSHMDPYPSLFPTFVHPNLFNDEAIFSCLSAESHLTLHLNMLDLSLERSFKSGKWLSLAPHLGLRAAWLDQTYDVDYFDLYAYRRSAPRQVLDSYLTHIVNNFWGLGIQGGLGLDFAIRWGLSVFGDFTAALLYGFFDTSYMENFAHNANEIEGITLSEHNSFHAGRAIADFQLGLRWHRSFAKDRITWALQAAWEQHIFFSQNQMLHFVDGQSWGNFIQGQSDVYFQGFSASTSLFF